MDCLYWERGTFSVEVSLVLQRFDLDDGVRVIIDPALFVNSL